MLYQTIGGAVIVPLYLVAFTWKSASAGYWARTRSLPLDKAKTLLPAVFFGYLLPTLLVYYPFSDIDSTMIVVAFWQSTPIVVNLLWYGFSSLISSESGLDANADLRHVSRALLAPVILCSAAHGYVLYRCLSPNDPNVTLTSVFLPRQWAGMQFDEAVHFIFQVDYSVIFLATTIWSIQSVIDVKRWADEDVSAIGASILTLLGASISGPAATLCAVWYWRESKLASPGGVRKQD